MLGETVLSMLTPFATARSCHPRVGLFPSPCGLDHGGSQCLGAVDI